jgi:hypothetical protein
VGVKARIQPLAVSHQSSVKAFLKQAERDALAELKGKACLQN